MLIALTLVFLIASAMLTSKDAVLKLLGALLGIAGLLNL